MRKWILLFVLATLLLAAPPTEAADAGWWAEYYANPWLSGSPALTRSDSEINFNWGRSSPAAGIPADYFSARWTRTIRLDEGRYRFITTTDDGVRLYLDGHLLMDRWREQSARQYQVEVWVAAGEHNVRLEYYESGGLAVAKLRWQRATDAVGNIITCVRPYDSWVKVYRLDGSEWIDVNPHGWGPIDRSGYLKLDGFWVDTLRYGSGHPYRVELWANGSLIRAVGDTAAGQPEFRIYPWTDNFTPWGCPAP